MKKVVLLVLTLLCGSIYTKAQWQNTVCPCNINIVNEVALMGTNVFVGTTSGGMFLSANYGNTYTAVNSGLNTAYTIYSLAVSGSNIFAGTTNTGGSIFLSTDTGASWTAVNSGLLGNVHAIAISGTNIFAGTDVGVYLSDNNGASWTAVSNGFGTTKNVRSLAIMGTNIFAGTSQGGVFVSTNNGSSWLPVNNGLTNFSACQIHSLAVSGTNLFAGVLGSGTNGGVFLSTNNGGSWMPVNSGLTDSTNVNALIVSGSNVFAGTQYSGVFLSTDTGANWTSFNDGMTDTLVYSLAVDSTNIFAGTYRTPGGGVWKRALTDITTSVKDISKDNGFSIFPIPTSGSFTLKISDSKEQLLRIFDVLGGEVYSEKIFGSYEYEVRTKLLPGIYFVQLHDENKTFAKKIVVN